MTGLLAEELRTLDDRIQRPGTTGEGRKGVPRDERSTGRLMRPWFWKGAAWCQREVTIPESWAGKRITLMPSESLEMTR
jgi:hypothetical protein